MNNLCKKQTTLAIIISPNDNKFYGYNQCLNPQELCPRDIQNMKSGEGYELCTEICNQIGHAEIEACKSAGVNAIGGSLYLFGHTYCCGNCISVMQQYGIKNVYIISNEIMTLAYKFSYNKTGLDKIKEELNDSK